MGYLGLCTGTPNLSGRLIGVLGPPTELSVHILLGPTKPGDPILLGPVPCEPTILGLVPGCIILGLTSPGLIIFCLRLNGIIALGDALPCPAGAT